MISEPVLAWAKKVYRSFITHVWAHLPILCAQLKVLLPSIKKMFIRYCHLVMKGWSFQLCNSRSLEKGRFFFFKSPTDCSKRINQFSVNSSWRVFRLKRLVSARIFIYQTFPRFSSTCLARRKAQEIYLKNRVETNHSYFIFTLVPQFSQKNPVDMKTKLYNLIRGKEK